MTQGTTVSVTSLSLASRDLCGPGPCDFKNYTPLYFNISPFHIHHPTGIEQHWCGDEGVLMSSVATADLLSQTF